MIPLITPNNPRVFFPRIKTALGVFEYFDVAVVRSIYITILERIRWNLAVHSWQHFVNRNVLVDAIGYFDAWWMDHLEAMVEGARAWAEPLIRRATIMWGPRTDVMQTIDVLRLTINSLRNDLFVNVMLINQARRFYQPGLLPANRVPQL